MVSESPIRSTGAAPGHEHAITDTRWPHAIQRDTWPNRFVPVPPPWGWVQSRSDRMRMWSGRWLCIEGVRLSLDRRATGETAAHQSAQHSEAVDGGELLAGVGRARLVAHRHLEDLL